MIIENISLTRRRFLGGVLSAGAFVVASRIVPDELFAQEAIFRTKADAAALHPSVYLGIEPDGTVFIVTHRSEMGTGIRTSLPAGRGRRARRGLEPRSHRAGRGRHAVRRPEHRRIAIDSRLLRRVPRGGRIREVDAGHGRGRAVERAGVGVYGREPRDCSREEREEDRLRGTRARGGEAAGAGQGRADVQAEDGVEVCRQGTADLRPYGHHDRRRAVRPRRVQARDGVRVDRASARARRDDQEPRRQGGAHGQGRPTDRRARYRQAARAVPAARRRRGDRRQYMGGDARPQEAEDRLERRRARQLQLR